MTLRTSGKAEHYRYFTCGTSARQGKTGCKGRTVQMDRLDNLVTQHLEQRLLDPERIPELWAGSGAGRLRQRSSTRDWQRRRQQRLMRS